MKRSSHCDFGLPRILYSVLVLFSSAALNCSQTESAVTNAVNNPSDTLVPFVLGSKWGYINVEGDIAIPARFDGADFFQPDGLAIVEVNTSWFELLVQGEPLKCGVINPQGAFVISPSYYWLGNFSNASELALARQVCDGNSAYGFIDKSDRLIIPPVYTWAGDFVDGLAPVMVDAKFGFIDATANFVIPPKFDGVSNFQEGLAPAMVGNKWGYIGKDGCWHISPRFAHADQFSEGLAAVVPLGTRRFGYITKEGSLAIQPKFERAHEFYEGLARVTFDGRQGYIGQQGQWLIRPRFSWAQDFSQGRAGVYEKGSTFFINHEGKHVLGPYDGAESFRNGFARINLQYNADGTYSEFSIINLKGEIIWRPSGNRQGENGE